MSNKNELNWGFEENAEVQTPNTKYTEVGMTTQVNKAPTGTVSPTIGKTQSSIANNGVVKVQPSTFSQGAKNNTTTNATQNTQNQQANQQANQQVTTPTENQANTSIVVPISTDLNDETVQKYLNDYRTGIQNNNYQAQINALSAIDTYRTQNGLEAKYTQTIYELNNQRNQKIQSAIKEYENQIANAVYNGDYSTAQEIGQQLEAYKKSVNYQDNVGNSATYLKDIEYKNTYDEVINGIVSNLLTMRFTYDPSDDEALLKAQEYATNTALEKMNSKGILDSTMTAQIVTATVANLETEYQQMAKEEFYANIERMQSMANFIIGLEETQYDRWLQNVQLNLEYYSALQEEQEYQWKRVENLGYVDNEASLVLGVSVGMLSPSMRQSIQDAQAETQKSYNELLSDITLAAAKQAISNGSLTYDLSTGGLVQGTGNSTSGSTTSGNTSNTTNGSNATTTSGVTANSKFAGQLDSTALKSQMRKMYNDALDKVDDETRINYYDILKFARTNAKTFNDYTKAIGTFIKNGDGETGLTLEEANTILYPNVKDIINQPAKPSSKETTINQLITKYGKDKVAIEAYLLENYSDDETLLEELLYKLDEKIGG